VLIETIEKEHGNQLQELSKRLAELENQQAKNSAKPYNSKTISNNCRSQALQRLPIDRSKNMS